VWRAVAGSSSNPPILQIDLADRARAESLRDAIAAQFGERVRVITSPEPRPSAKLVSLEAISERDEMHNVIAVGDVELPIIVEKMSRYPWLDHVACPKMISSTASLGVLWRMLCGGSAEEPRFFGKGFSGRQVLIRDSEQREDRIEAIARSARESGVSERLAAQISDVTEEMLTNALYDAPAEREGVPADRMNRMVLERDQACVVTYGEHHGMFFVRVRDQYGSLRRARLFDVLRRCVHKGEVDIDSTRGGAGLGMMRIFEAASLLILHVREHVSTEFLVGFEMKRRRSVMHDRAVHLFFERGDEVNGEGIE
jgi:hypothetical protein